MVDGKKKTGQCCDKKKGSWISIPITTYVSLFMVASKTNVFPGDFTYSCFDVNVYVPKATPLMLQKAVIKIRFKVLCSAISKTPP